MSVFYDLSKTPRNILNKAIVRAIVSENNGLLFDPSDMSTLYQDAAGTTPVTAVEQPVGKILDKSGNGNHATQSVTASRPVLSARKNVLLASETLATQSVTTIAAKYTLSFTGTGSVTLSGAATGTLTGTGAANRVSLTVTPTAGTLTLTVSGSVTKAQLELGAVSGPYQRVNTATDYDTNPALFPKYLKFDGIDDYLNLPYMGLYANGSASAVSSYRLNSKSTQALLLSEANSGKAAPLYYFHRHLGASGYINFLIRNNTNTTICDFTDTNTVDIGAVGVKSSVDTGATIKQWDNSGDYDAVNYTRQGVVTLNNTTIGALIYTAASSYFNGNLYGLIITKSALTDAQRVKCERFLAQKAGVTL